MLATREITKHYPGCYRISGNRLFGQIKKYGSGWQGEVRERETGNIVRFAGHWLTKRECVEEVEFILDRED